MVNGVVIVVSLQQKHEFIATDPGYGVAAAQCAGEPFGHGFQGLVTGRMAPFVINGLEAIQVQVAHGHASVLPIGVVSRGAQSLFQQLAVRQAGQVIVVGGPVQFPGVVLERGDIRERRHMVILPGFFQVHPADGKQFHVLFTVFPAVPDFAPPVVGFFDGPPHGRDTQPVFAVFPVRDVVLNGDIAGCNVLFGADRNAIGMHPVRFAGFGVMKNILFNHFSPMQLLVNALDGFRVSVPPVQHFPWQTSAHILKPVTGMLFEAGIHPLNTARIVQHYQKIGRNRGNHGEAIGVDVCGWCNRCGGSGHESQ